MGKKTEVTHTYTCDSCKKTVVSMNGRMPCSPHDSWGTIFIKQDAGFDHHGCPWCNRMEEPAILCGKCIDRIMDFIQNNTALEEDASHD